MHLRLKRHSSHSRTSEDLPVDEDAGANGRVDEYSAAGEGAEARPGG